MTKSTIIAAMAVSLLAGCGSMQQLQMKKAGERMEVAKAICKADFPNHYSDRADCFTAAENAILGPLVTNESDLLMLYQARRKVTAVRVDQHQMTIDEAKLDDASSLVLMRQQSIDRANAADMVFSAQLQSYPILVPVPVSHRH